MVYLLCAHMVNKLRKMVIDCSSFVSFIHFPSQLAYLH